MWSPLSAPYPYTPDAVQSGPAPYHNYQGTDNQAALMWALMKAATDPDHEPFVMPRGLAMTGPLRIEDASGNQIQAPEGFRFVNDTGGVILGNSLCNGGAIVNLGGVGGGKIEGLAVGRAAFNPSDLPFCVVYYAVGPLGSGNVSHFEGLSLFGRTSGAVFFNEGGVSSSMSRSQIHTFGAGHAMWHRGALGWDFRTVELHDQNVKWRQDTRIPPAPYHTGYGDKSPVRFDNSEDFHFTGGNFGGNAPLAVEFHGTNRKLTFDTVQIYAQDPPPKLANGQTGPGKPYNGIFRNHGVVDGLWVRGCRIDASSFVYGAADGATYRDIHHSGRVGPFMPANMVACDAQATFEDVDMDCSGLPFRANAHLGGVVNGGEIRNVSVLDAIKTGGLKWRTTDGRWHTDQPWVVG